MRGESGEPGPPRSLGGRFPKASGFALSGLGILGGGIPQGDALGYRVDAPLARRTQPRGKTPPARRNVRGKRPRQRHLPHPSPAPKVQKPISPGPRPGITHRPRLTSPERAKPIAPCDNTPQQRNPRTKGPKTHQPAATPRRNAPWKRNPPTNFPRLTPETGK